MNVVAEKRRAILQAARRAWPAMDGRLHGGWYCRASADPTKRANSVWPIGGTQPKPDEVGKRIDECERWYGERGRPCFFLVPETPELAALRGELDRRQYGAIDPSAFQVRDIEALEANSTTIVMEHRPVALVMNALSTPQMPAHHRQARAALFNAIRKPKCFAVRIEGGKPVAGGLGVADGELLGIFNMHTHVRSRGRGYASEVLRHLLAWSTGFGCRQAYLQIEHANRAAKRLYAKHGFARLFDYHYRINSIRDG